MQLVVQAAVVNFASGCRIPRATSATPPGVPRWCPQDLTRRHRPAPDRRHGAGLDGVLPRGRADAGRNDEQATILTVGILRYSRNLAFAAAKAYADRQARGAWDSRMEGRASWTPWSAVTPAPNCCPGPPR